MKKIKFTKMVASGNDFVVISHRGCPIAVQRLPFLAKRMCDHKYGVGADGLLILEKSGIADVRMRIFNPDGSQPNMCGNGARCTALYSARRNVTIETNAGIIESRVSGDNVKIRLTDPRGLRLGIPIRLNSRTLRVNFINTGVPHTVIFAASLDDIDVANLGRQIRYHPRFRPAGTNVDFVEVLSDRSIGLRTYERGVEDQTLACGTGAVASALITVARYQLSALRKIDVTTKSGEVLKVYFDKIGNRFNNVWLEGKVRIIYKGEYYV